jgi:hypothetical protein
MQQYEYSIAAAQLNFVTFVDGQWQGTLPPNAAGALQSCPRVWDFLNEMGQEGWDLVSVVANPVEEQAEPLTTLYLKRELE